MEIKREEAIVLNRLLENRKIGKISQDGAFALLDNKIALSKHVKALEEAQKIASEECKPEELKKEGAEETEELRKLWNEKYGEYMIKHMGEMVDVELKKLNREDYMLFVQSNDLSIGEAEFITIIRHD